MRCFNALHLSTILFLIFIPYAYGTGRIVGGVETTITKRPYQASLQYYLQDVYYHACGASIISTKHLLTAAHCHPFQNLDIFYARVGSTTYNEGGQVLKIDKFNWHPLFFNSFKDYDIAIITFVPGMEIILGPNIAVVSLTEGSNPHVGSLLTVSGWGVTSESASQLPLKLREANLLIVDHEDCKFIYPYLTDRHLCLGGTKDGMLSACFGDSGGPCVQNEVQYAIVSGGNSCELPNVPGIYTKISRVRDWIREETGV